MIRAVVALFVFSVGLCLFIVMRPDTPRVSLPASAPAVARAPTQDAALIRHNATGPVIADIGIKETTAEVLQGLGLNRASIASDDPLANQSQEAVNDIYAITGQQKSRSHLAQIVLSGLKQGMTDADIAQHVDTAATAHQTAVPASLITTHGTVDTHTLLAEIVAQAKLATGHPKPPANLARGTKYAVTAGDSLGAIALAIYGDATMATTIFDANRHLLTRADQITVGQVLNLP